MFFKDFYQGFWITEPKGNNAFSFQERQNKRIFVAPLIRGDLHDLEGGQESVFSEFFEGQEINKKGLKVFVCLKKADKHIFIFDNHNHAFFFWLVGLKEGLIKQNLTLLHVDQHKDTRKPSKYLDFRPTDIDLQEAFRYTNDILNVGNFLSSAIHSSIFSKVEFLDNEESFSRDYAPDYILDLDMDIFADEMEYIPYQPKIDKLRSLIDKTRFITIATSPYFMEQEKAIKIIHELFSNNF